MNKKDFMTVLSTQGLLEVSGLDAAKFLQGQVTCDVREVTEHQSSLGAHCDPKGRVQFTFRLFKYNDCYYLLLEKKVIPHALVLLQKYLIFTKTKITDVSDEWFCLGLVGLDASKFLATIYGLVITKSNQVATNSLLLALAIPGDPLRIELIGRNEQINSLKENLHQKMTIESGEQWQLLDIEAGIPHISMETAGLFTPHDINYPALGGVSFNKGCYTGQEIVARMHYLGKPKQSLYRIQIGSEQKPAPGYKIVSDNQHEKREVGCLVNVALKPEGGYLALAVLQDTASEKNIYLEKSQAILSIIQ